MGKTVVGIFNSYSDAENATRQVKESGLKTSDISVIAKTNEQVTSDVHEGGSDVTAAVRDKSKPRINDNISGGVVTGGVLGGLAGLLIGVGTMAVPGLGIVAAAGPITGLLSGAITGGVVGGLVDLGIPERKGKEYEDQIQEGKILWSMAASDEHVDTISEILKENGATKVETY